MGFVGEAYGDRLLAGLAVHRGEQVYVEAKDGKGTFEPHDVRVGIVDGNRVQVAEGLAEGDEVTLR